MFDVAKASDEELRRELEVIRLRRKQGYGVPRKKSGKRSPTVEVIPELVGVGDDIAAKILRDLAGILEGSQPETPDD